MINPTTDREKLLLLEKELEHLSKDLALVNDENTRLRAEAQRDAAYNDQREKNIYNHLIEIIKLGAAVIAGLLGIKYGIK